MSEAAPEEFNPNLEEEEAGGEEPEEQEEQQPAGDDAAKLKKALERERNAKKKALKDLAELRKQAQQGDPNKGEMEKLTQQVQDLDASLRRTSAVATLLESGFNGSRAQAEKMIRLVDDFDGDEWVDELKTDFPERFGKRRAADGDQPFRGGGRPNPGGTPKSADATHVDRLLKMGRK